MSDSCDYNNNIATSTDTNIQQTLSEYNQLLSQEITQYNNTFPYFDAKSGSTHHFLSRAQANVAILMIGINYFKEYNDIYGHIEGDICFIDLTMLAKNLVVNIENEKITHGGSVINEHLTGFV